MKSTLQVALVAALVVGLLVVDGASKKPKKEIKHARPKAKKPPASANIPTSVDAGEHAYVPNPDVNETDYKYLRCTHCKTLVDSIERRFSKVTQEFQYEPSKIKGFHIEAALDEMCQPESMHHGLWEDEKSTVVSPWFLDENWHHPVSNGRATLIKGGWVTSWWFKYCEEQMAAWDDEFDGFSSLYWKPNPQLCSKHCGNLAPHSNPEDKLWGDLAMGKPIKRETKGGEGQKREDL